MDGCVYACVHSCMYVCMNVCKLVNRLFAFSLLAGSAGRPCLFLICWLVFCCHLFVCLFAALVVCLFGSLFACLLDCLDACLLDSKTRREGVSS